MNLYWKRNILNLKFPGLNFVFSKGIKIYLIFLLWFYDYKFMNMLYIGFIEKINRYEL